MSGRLIGVVGPSGVGKDTIMEGLVAARPGMGIARRDITRTPGLGGEAYRPVTRETFDRGKSDGAYCLSWEAHDLFYGIPVTVLDEVRAGTEVLVNLSRGVLADAAKLGVGFCVLNITAQPRTLAARLKGRGRESEPEIARRLQRRQVAYPDHVTVHDIPNDGEVGEAIDLALAALDKVEADA